MDVCTSHHFLWLWYFVFFSTTDILAALSGIYSVLCLVFCTVGFVFNGKFILYMLYIHVYMYIDHPE